MAADEPVFEDALSDHSGDDGAFQDAECAGELLRPRLPGGVPSGQEVLAQAAAIRRDFQPAGPEPLPLTEEIARCRDVMAAEAPPFFAFTRLLGEEQKHAVWTLFGVCQEFADVKTIGELDQRRQSLKEVFKSCRASSNGKEPAGLWAALRAVLGRYGVTQRPFEDYADGVASRPKPHGPAFGTLDELLTYAYRSAGVAGLISLPVLAEEVALDPEVVEASIALGMALQLTDMLNCMGHHFRQGGHCWAPRECLERHRIEFEELESNLREHSTTLVDSPRWHDLMRELLALVPPFLRSAAAGGEKLPGGGRVAVRAAVRMCRRMLSRIEARNYNSLGPHEEMFSWRIIGDISGALFFTSVEEVPADEAVPPLSPSSPAAPSLLAPTLPMALPSAAPTGAAVLCEVSAVRAAFQARGARAMELTDAVAKCRDIMSSESPPFFAFTRLLAEDQKLAVWVLFGVTRELAGARCAAELDAGRRQLGLAFDPKLAQELPGVWGALRSALGRYAMIRRPFYDYAEGVESRPSRGVAFPDIAAMLNYAYRTAGVIGLISLPVLAEESLLDPQVIEAAMAMGIALQLTDMLNCLGHHFRTHGMCWVPATVMRCHSISYEELERNLSQQSTSLVEDVRWHSLMQQLLTLVPPFLKAAATGGERLPGGGRLAVRAAVRMCRRMLDRIEARGYNSLGPHEEMFSWRVIGDVAGAVFASDVPPAPPPERPSTGVASGNDGI